MPCSTLRNVRLKAVYAAVPEQEITIESELAYYGSFKKLERARRMLGTDRRRVTWDNLTASDLCKAAAERLLREQDVDRQTLDAIIFVSQSPDYELPATAGILQHTLGLSNSCAAFDVNQGCSGYVYGLWLGGSLIGSGACRRVLLLAGDANTARRDVRNRVTAPILCDGGSASLLEYDATAAPIPFSLGTDGSGFRHLLIPGGRSRVPFARDLEGNKVFFTDITTSSGTPWRLGEVYMNGLEVFKFILDVVPGHLQQFLTYCDTTQDAIDWVILHQANKQIVEAVADKSGFPLPKVPCETFSRYGNLSSASVPATFCDTFGKAGTSGRQRLLLSGFGVGFSWASCLIEARDIACAPVLDVRPPEGAPGPKEWLSYWISVLSGTNVGE